MPHFKCPKCGNISNALTGFTDVTENNEYTINESGKLKLIEELSTFRDDVKFECQECNETFTDYNDFEVIQDG